MDEPQLPATIERVGPDFSFCMHPTVRATAYLDKGAPMLLLRWTEGSERVSLTIPADIAKNGTAK